MSTARTHKITLTEAEQFFYEHAGYSWDPKTETATSGRTRVAVLLAAAEGTLEGSPLSVTWTPDDQPAECACGNPDCVSDGAPAWVVQLRGPDERCNDLPSDSGEVLTASGGYDFPSGEPWGEASARVAAAQLVAGWLADPHY